MPDERALSNTLGFVLLFGVILVSIGVTATVGFGSIEEARDGTIQLNAEKAMQNVGAEVEQLRSDDTTLRSSLLRTGGGTVGSATSTSRLQVDVGDDGSFELDQQFRPLVFRYQDSRLVYEAGAIIRVEDNGQRPVSAPDIRDSGNQLIFPIVTMSPANPGTSIGGESIVAYFQRTDSALLAQTQSGEEVRIQIVTTPTRAEAWREMIANDELSPDSCSGSGGTVSCVWDRQNVIVRHMHVQYELVT